MHAKYLQAFVLEQNIQTSRNALVRKDWNLSIRVDAGRLTRPQSTLNLAFQITTQLIEHARQHAQRGHRRVVENLFTKRLQIVIHSTGRAFARARLAVRFAVEKVTIVVGRASTRPKYVRVGIGRVGIDDAQLTVRVDPKVVDFHIAELNGRGLDGRGTVVIRGEAFDQIGRVESVHERKELSSERFALGHGHERHATSQIVHVLGRVEVAARAVDFERAWPGLKQLVEEILILASEHHKIGDESSEQLFVGCLERSQIARLVLVQIQQPNVIVEILLWAF